MPLNYRPWGDLNWLLSKCPTSGWQFIGCIGTEQRSVSALAELQRADGIQGQLAVLIDDASRRFKGDTQALLDQRLAEFRSFGGRGDSIVNLPLFTSVHEITSLVTNLSDNDLKNVILDITSFPKRFFFPLMKVLFRSTAVENLIAAYSVPEGYPDDPLSEDFEDWRSLPLFGGASPETLPEILIVNVGHLPMGLPDQVLHGPRMEVNLLFPFPNAPLSHKKTWEFVWAIERNLHSKSIVMKHVSPIDVSDAFDHIGMLTERGQRRAMFAPYGPKPISLAMCLHAILTDDPVYYTQPRCYRPDYSYGVAMENGHRKVWTYLIKRDGVNYYEL